MLMASIPPTPLIDLSESRASPLIVCGSRKSLSSRNRSSSTLFLKDRVSRAHRFDNLIFTWKRELACNLLTPAIEATKATRQGVDTSRLWRHVAVPSRGTTSHARPPFKSGDNIVKKHILASSDRDAVRQAEDSDDCPVCDVLRDGTTVGEIR